MSEKKYVKGVYLKKGKFGLKMSINVEKFCDEIKRMQNEKGFINVDINELKQVDKFNNTHYMVVDEWKPSTPTGGLTNGNVPQPETEEDLLF